MQEKIKNIVLYVGSFCSVIFAVAYIAFTSVMLVGLQVELTLETGLYILISNAVGLCISFSLRLQGVDLGKNKKEVAEMIDRYDRLTNKKKKDKKLKGLSSFWIQSEIQDILIKGLVIGVMSIGLIYVSIEGSKDWGLLLTAITNLLMYFSFGALALVKAYNFVTQDYIRVLDERIQRLEGGKTDETA